MDRTYLESAPTFPLNEVYPTIKRFFNCPAFALPGSLLLGLSERIRADIQKTPKIVVAITELLIETNKIEIALELVLSEQLQNVSKATLMREDSLASMMARETLRIMGAPYLTETFGDLIEQVLASGDSFEVDPDFESDPKKIEENKQKFLNWSYEFNRRLFTSADKMPAIIRKVTHTVSKVVSERFAADPDCEQLSINCLCSLILLRWVSISLVAPVQYGIIRKTKTPVSPQQRKNLMNIAKMIQSFAWGGQIVDDPKREEQMEHFRTFISKLRAEPPAQTVCQQCVDDSEGVDEGNGNVLISYLQTAGTDRIVNYVSDSTIPSILDGTCPLPLQDIAEIMNLYARLKWLGTLDMTKLPEAPSVSRLNLMRMRNNTAVHSGSGPEESEKLVDWLERSISHHRYVFIIFFRGGFCLWCKRHLGEWAGLHQLVKNTGGALFGITAEKPAVVQKTKETWSIPFELVSDPEGILARSYNSVIDTTPAWRAFADLENSNGLQQPSIVCVDQQREIQYFWRQIPSIANGFGSMGRPDPHEVLLDVLERILDKEATLTRISSEDNTSDSDLSSLASSAQALSITSGEREAMKDTQVLSNITSMDNHSLNVLIQTILENDRLAVAIYKQIKPRKKYIREARKREDKRAKENGNGGTLPRPLSPTVSGSRRGVSTPDSLRKKKFWLCSAKDDTWRLHRKIARGNEPPGYVTLCRQLKDIGLGLDHGGHQYTPPQHLTTADIDWDSLPHVLDPQQFMTLERGQRKRAQIQSMMNLIHTAIERSPPGIVRVVDFCCGSGHLGLVVAWLYRGPDIDWDSLPHVLDPQQFMTLERGQRKRAQIQSMMNLIHTAIERSPPGIVRVVDFCCGSGHLGLVVAWLYRGRVKVTLVERNPVATDKAKERIQNLLEANQSGPPPIVDVVTGMMEDFNSPFDLGIAIHACGFLSDLVQLKCFTYDAAYVICPCCLGKVSAMHELNAMEHASAILLPQRLQKYFDLVRYGDFGEWIFDTEIAVGRRGCKTLVEIDRNQAARERGYETLLVKMQPENCTPKNDIIAGSSRYYLIELSKRRRVIMMNHTSCVPSSPLVRKKDKGMEVSSVKGFSKKVVWNSKKRKTINHFSPPSLSTPMTSSTRGSPLLVSLLILSIFLIAFAQPPGNPGNHGNPHGGPPGNPGHHGKPPGPPGQQCCFIHDKPSCERAHQAPGDDCYWCKAKWGRDLCLGSTQVKNLPPNVYDCTTHP
ncbi:putative glutathione S-transferase C-terminal domain-containing protein [Planoprotostelium fungivorum]|uniref:Putative glutathione S-transferase C-terminal domain-containing protein n=1 Tax=Planoprotostelium fungivorum TaxID=1890364 RepID=A0A2P6MUD1_9EUKA|nr:putative glutathione S-transferase C-terminal domain-containing protein [Planoprotostelium fungivorum]